MKIEDEIKRLIGGREKKLLISNQINHFLFLLSDLLFVLLLVFTL